MQTPRLPLASAALSLVVLLMVPPGDAQSPLLQNRVLGQQPGPAGAGDLAVVSEPPKAVRGGETLRYQVEVRSKSGQPTFQLETGPEGMVVSESGLMEWTPAPQLAPSRVGVILSVKDSGRATFHTFALDVFPPDDILASADDGPPPGTWTGDKAKGSLRLKFPAPYDDVCLGGDGRYLIFTLPSAQKAAIFDVTAAKIVGYVPIVDDCYVAAGMDKLVVVNAARATIERFDLQTRKSERTQSLLTKEEVDNRFKPSGVAMGFASHGPVLVFITTQASLPLVRLLDLDTLTTPEGMRKEPSLDGAEVRPEEGGDASADEHLFCFQRGFTRGLRIGNQDLLGRPEKEYVARSVISHETGEPVYTLSDIQRGWSRRAGSVEPKYDPFRNGLVILAPHGPLYLRLKPQSDGFSASVCLVDEDLPVATLRGIVFPTKALAQMNRGEKRPVERRVFFLPAAKRIVMLAEGEAEIVLRWFDLDEELGRFRPDYLAVVSRPPRIVRPGTTFEYQLDVRSKAGKVQCRLDFGPKGMQVSPAGLVRWEAANPPDEPTARARVLVTDGSGQTIPHEFHLTTGEKPAATAPAADQPADDWTLTRIDEHRLAIPGRTIGHGLGSRPDPTERLQFVLAPGWRYESMLLLQGNHLAVLSADGMRVLRTHTLRAPYSQIAEREEYYVAISPQRPKIDLLDKKTLAIVREIHGEEWVPLQIALHPTRPVTYVAVASYHTQPIHYLMVLDESEGRVGEPSENRANWLAIDAAGQRLVASIPVTDKVPAASDAPANPAVRPVPAFALVVYDLDDDGSPRKSDVSEHISGTSQSLRTAPDGLRVAMVREIGNCDAMNLDSLGEKPIEYPMEGKPVLDLAYHPVLPLVACLAPTGPIMFDRETGKPQPNVVKPLPAELNEAKFQHLWFAADGKGLLLELDGPSGDSCLARVELDLSSADLERVGRRLANMASLGRDLLVDHPAEPGKGTVPLSEIDAFKGGRGEEMSAKDIGRALTDAVVVVESGPRSGTGFVVGASGYILTGAHCVREPEGIAVSYRSKQGENVEMKRVPARLLRVDYQKDLALLKIDEAPRLATVRLALGTNVESGERVTIIGNPGAEHKVLDYTMTEGIVSNARRQLRRQTLIQTSAAVNPGSSGAPLFNSRGRVIGLVVIKANLEGVGFAVPAEELGTFLAVAVKATGAEGAIERQWFDADGKHEITAQYLGIRDGSVQLRRADGTDVSVPLAKLSPQDQAFVRLFQSK